MRKFAVAMIGLMMMLLSTGIANGATFSSLQAYGVDTIAGYSTLLSTSKTFPSTDVVITVKKPDGSIISIPAKTDSAGVAKVDLYDYHTRRAGTYTVSAYLKENPVAGSSSTFKVYPDEVSLEKSTIYAQKTVVKANGDDKAYLTVKIVDQYGNPFGGHVVRVISSRADDYVSTSTYGATTDINGAITFIAASDEPGVSIFSAVDATSGVVLAQRAEVAFLNNVSSLENVGGNLNFFIPVASAQSGPLNKFEISGIPGTVEPNTNISFTVKAQDQDGLTVENYTGTVHFSAEGESGLNVTLPEDYTFKAEDLGEHEFSLGLKFIESGVYKIVATDIANTVIKGEQEVTVGSSSSGTSSGASGTKPTVASPVAGTYSQNIQTISGKAANLSTVRIYDNDQEIGQTQADLSGSYSFQTTALADGTHNIYVVWLDDTNTVKGTSDTVSIMVDTTAPAVDDLTITPESGIKAGDVMNVRIMSEANLSDAAVIFNSEIYTLSPSLDEDGVYLASFQAPATAGEYPLDIFLSDELGNEATYPNQLMVAISESGDASVSDTTGTDTTDTTEETIEIPPVVEDQAPSQVFGVIAYGADKRVTLVWEASTDDGLIDHYRIYYGTDPLNLDSVADTKDAATSWYIPDLENGREYFFAVSAVDDTNLESLYTSELVSGIPFTLEVQTAITERPDSALSMGEEEAYLRGAAIEGNVPPEMIQNGPELIWLLIGTGALSGLSRKLSKRKK